jgi:undecaprenyl-diphosphatase
VAAAATVAASLAVFLLLARNLHDGGPPGYDQAVLDWFVAHRTPALIGAAKVASTIGSFVGLFVLGVVAGVLLWRWPLPVPLPGAPLLALVIASLASNLTKSYVARERPPVSLQEVATSLPAFPSGHAADSAAFFIATALTVSLGIAGTGRRVLVLLAGIGATVLVGLSRLVLAVHWASDVIAGWALGTAVALTVVTAARLAAARFARGPGA